MTEEHPLRDPAQYKPHQPSEENGLVEDLEEGSPEPEYLLEEERDTPTTFQLDFGYFTHQTDIYEFQ